MWDWDGRTLAPWHQLDSFPFTTRLLPSPLLRTASFKKKKERLGPPSHHSRVGPVADVAVRPKGASAVAPSNLSGPAPSASSQSSAETALGAHARGESAPRAATSGASVEVRFRVAAPLAGRPWGLVTRAGVHGRPRRRGSAGCPESGRCAGGRPQIRADFILSVASVCPQSGPDGVAPRPKAGGGTGLLKAGGGGQR